MRRAVGDASFIPRRQRRVCRGKGVTTILKSELGNEAGYGDRSRVTRSHAGRDGCNRPLGFRPRVEDSPEHTVARAPLVIEGKNE